MNEKLKGLARIEFSGFAGIVTLTEEQVRENPFLSEDGEGMFYRLIREMFESGKYEVDTIDCTKMEVAGNLMDSWFAYGKEHGVDCVELAMSIGSYGPKACSSFPENAVEIQEGCLTFKERGQDRKEDGICQN